MKKGNFEINFIGTVLYKSSVETGEFLLKKLTMEKIWKN